MNFAFPVLFILCLPLSCPAFYLAYKLASKRQLGSIFNQNIFFLLIVTGGSKSKPIVYPVAPHHWLGYSSGFYTAFSLSSLLYISLDWGDSREEVQIICGYEISIRLFVVYCWFNTFFINVHFRNISSIACSMEYVCILYLHLDTSSYTMASVWSSRDPPTSTSSTSSTGF